MHIEVPEYIREVLTAFERNGFESYCVGGSVRDAILGKTPEDWDITTNALPKETEKIFDGEKIIETGIKHGTVTLIKEHHPIEITTYRTDGDYGDNRHPEQVTFTRSLQEDLKRRDFTVNAIAFNPALGLVDLYGGQEDIYNSILRTVGDPSVRFHEDGLRIMRALRFAAVLGFSIEENTQKAIHECKDLLKNISAERIQTELVKMLCGKYIYNVITEYADVLGVVIPEILPCVGFRQYGKKHAYDVWEHICHTVDTIPDEKDLRLTMFLHDLGKIPTHALNEKGDSTFKNHATVGGEMAKEILARLKFDKKTVNRVSFLVSYHDFEPPESKTELKKKMLVLSPEDVRTLLIIKKSDRGALSESYRDISEGTRRTLEWLDEIEKNNECYRISHLKVNGKDLSKLGISGEKIGKVLLWALNEVVENRVENGKNELLQLIETQNAKGCAFDA